MLYEALNPTSKDDKDKYSMNREKLTNEIISYVIFVTKYIQGRDAF